MFVFVVEEVRMFEPVRRGADWIGEARRERAVSFVVRGESYFTGYNRYLWRGGARRWGGSRVTLDTTARWSSSS